ncbi:Uncharacterised protein [Pragia fontium]|uniref:DUF3828 domain-containing protein n=1 Tax=Pragia fontium TaxID=82985 RepID=UPI000E05E77D|nr:DUF3828 domain-containing protein [Pragia fontium]SUB82847.1 Uncharacterised protein [Pragia fontium]
MPYLKWVGCFCLLMISGHAFAAQSSGPEAFLAEIYNSYREGSEPVRFSETGNKQIISERFMQAVNEDQELAEGEVGFFDSDPICQCQDWETMNIDDIKVISLNDGEAIGIVHYSLWKSGTPKQSQSFKLILQNKRWYIADIITEDGSLLNTLEESNRKVKQQLTQP